MCVFVMDDGILAEFYIEYWYLIKPGYENGEAFLRQ